MKLLSTMGSQLGFLSHYQGQLVFEPFGFIQYTPHTIKSTLSILGSPYYTNEVLWEPHRSYGCHLVDHYKPQSPLIIYQ